MANNLTLTDLPIEIIQYILKDKNISWNDKVNLSKTCKKLNIIIEGENFKWEKKFFTICPCMKISYETYCNNGGNPIVCWKECVQCYQEFYKLYFEHIKRVKNSDGSYPPSEARLSKEKIRKFEDLTDTNRGASPFGFQIVFDQLEKLKNPKNSHSIEERHRITQLQRYIMDGYVVTAWKSFYKLPPLKQTMEECGLLALQLFYANESLQFYNLRKKFDLLIEETTYRLMESWPKIPSFPSIRGYMNIFKKNVIGDNHWYDINIMRVSEEMFDISLRKIGYMFHRADFNPLEIAIMYEGAAKRLGVCCTKNISKLILNEKKKRIKSRHFRYWYRLFLSAIKDLPKRKASLIKDIQRVMGTESFDTRHQFFLEQINLIEIPDNVDDFLQIAKLYVILKTVYWSVRSLHPEWQYLLRFDDIINEIDIWLTSWDYTPSYLNYNLY